MPIIFLRYKKKPWIVKYKEPWSGRPRQRAFAAEAEARVFEDAQAMLYERERAIIKAVRRRRSQGRPASPTVAEVLSRYLDSLGNPSTRAASAYHLRLFSDIFVPNCKNKDMNIWCFQNGSGYGANSTRSHLFRRRGTYFKQHCE